MARSLAGLTLRDLEYLVAVADIRHFGRAADHCGVSQPALSGQIRKLETWLGTPVFERAGKRVLLTPLGETIVRQAKVVIAEANRLAELARTGADALAGPCRLGIIPTLGPYLLPHILRPLRERFPALDLILAEKRTTELVSALQAGELDLALLSPPVPESGLAMEALFFEPFVLAHPPGHPVARAAPVALDALAAPGLLLLEEGHCLREQALTLCHAGPDRVRRHAAGIEMLRHMVAAGAGYSLLPALAAPGAGTADGLVSYTALAEPAGRTIALVWRASDPRAPHFRPLADFLRDLTPSPCRRLDSPARP